jgi:hypothetical protein
MAPHSRSGALLLLLLAAGAGLAHGSLMAIDLGSEYLRAVLIKPSGRGSPLQIVVNEMSRRKSPALVGVAGEDRLLGEEAFSFAIRYPTTVFSRTRDMLGRSARDPIVQNMLSTNLLPYELLDHPERGTVMAKVNSTAAYLAEELVVRGGAAGRGAHYASGGGQGVLPRRAACREPAPPIAAPKTGPFLLGRPAAAQLREALRATVTDPN